MIFLKLLIISAVMLTVSFAFLGIRIFLKKNGRFPETHAGHNNEMQKLGIRCSRNTDIGCVPADKLNSCPACGRIVT